MKNLLKAVILFISIGSVGLPLMLEKAEAKPAEGYGYAVEFDCPGGTKGTNCFSGGPGCDVVHCDTGPVISPE
jgi:hypothetical protein